MPRCPFSLQHEPEEIQISLLLYPFNIILILHLLYCDDPPQGGSTDDGWQAFDAVGIFIRLCSIDKYCLLLDYVQNVVAFEC